MKLTELEKQEIKKIGKKYNLKLIILHGSYATGKARTDSDLDIVIIGKKLIDFKKLAKIYSALSKVLGDNTKRELDIKTLNRADPLFYYHIAKYSELLYGSLLDYNEFRAYAFSSYYDSKDLFKLEGLLVSKFQNYLNKKYA